MRMNASVRVEKQEGINSVAKQPPSNKVKSWQSISLTGKKLIESPALKSVNFVDDLHIYTDASQYDASGIVLQKSKNGINT